MPMFRVMGKTVQQEVLERQLEDIERLLRPHLRTPFTQRPLTGFELLRNTNPHGEVGLEDLGATVREAIQGIQEFGRAPEVPEDRLAWTLRRARLGLSTDPQLWPGTEPEDPIRNSTPEELHEDIRDAQGAGIDREVL